jgi:hypothetical protein
LSLKTKVGGFLQFRIKTSGDGFSSLGLNTGSSDLVICASKSLWRFLSLCLKTKQTSVYRLLHKIDGESTAWDTHRDLTACLAWKQVVLGFPSLTSRLVEARQRVVHVAPSQRLRQDRVEDERFNATGYVRPGYPYFTVFYVLAHMNIIVFYLNL